MNLELLVPRQASIRLEELSAELAAPHGIARPFAPEVTAFCAEFSRALFGDSEARRYAELQALAFWMRKADLRRLEEDFVRAERDDIIRTPRGLVFHVPPGNVDTIGVYSWLLSVLAGNRNVVRVSRRESAQTEIICRLFRELGGTVGLAGHNMIVRYGHEHEITAAISALCDVRIIWGGDATVQAIRAIPLAPHAKELVFPDRCSFAVLRADKYLDLDLAGRAGLAAHFYNDLFWFDQMACSSPRAIIWCGGEECGEAARALYTDVAAKIAEKAYQPQAGSPMNKLTFAARAILDGQAASYTTWGQLTVLDSGALVELARNHCGGGLLYQYRIEGLRSLAPVLHREDQTLACFGFDRDELKAFALEVNGRGIDRFVPIGQALQFHRFWDGYDFLQELVRHVYIGV